MHNRNVASLDLEYYNIAYIDSRARIIEVQNVAALKRRLHGTAAQVHVKATTSAMPACVPQNNYNWRLASGVPHETSPDHQRSEHNQRQVEHLVDQLFQNVSNYSLLLPITPTSRGFAKNCLIALIS